MPRNPGTGVYEQPLPDVITATTIESAVYNGFVNDVETDLNTPRPIVAGGTGANNALDARNNLDVEVAMATVTNYDSHVFENGSFWSAAGASGAPNSTGTFGGMALVLNNDPNFIFIQVRDSSDTNVPPLVWFRHKRSGTWGAWSAGNVTGDIIVDGNLTINPDTPGTWPVIYLNRDNVAKGAAVVGQLNGVDRWSVQLGTASAAADFSILRFNDAGVQQDQPLIIARSDGLAYFNKSVFFCFGTNNQFSAATTGTANILSMGLSGANTTFIGASTTTGDFSITSHGTIPLSITSADFTVNRQLVLAGNMLVTGNNAVIQPSGTLLSPFAPSLSIGFVASTPGLAFRAPNDTGQWSVQFTNAAGTTVGNISTTAAATAYATFSDERLKEDLKSFDAGNIVDATNVYDFAWKLTAERAFGVIAQQAIDVYPAAVTYNKEADWYGIDYSKYVPVILQELKALRARVAELEGKAGVGAQPA